MTARGTTAGRLARGPARTVPAGPAPPVPTVGVEEEFFLLRPDGCAAWRAADVLAAVPPGVRVHREFLRYQIESTTGVCTDLLDAAAELRLARRLLAGAAVEAGARLVAVGTPPFDAPGAAALTDAPRYARLLEVVPHVTGQEASCACHVHVAVPTRDVGVAVVERIRGWLPLLLALTGNSPLWCGQDTGWSSYRYLVQGRWPTFVPPPRCADAAGYDDVVAGLVASGVAIDPGSVYFMARLSPRFPTVEIRVADACLEVDDAVLLAGLCRAVVATALADVRDGRPADDAVPDPVLMGALRRAARSGAAALDPVRGAVVPLGAALQSLLDRVAPALDAAGDRALVVGLLDARLARGPGAARQRAVLRAGDRAAFVRALAEMTAGGQTA